MNRIILTIIFLIVVFTSIWFYFLKTYPESAPLRSMEYFTLHLLQPHKSYKTYVIGFLPYWRLDQLSSSNPNNLSELSYFSLSVTPDGHIQTITNGQTDPGWYGWIQQSTKDYLTKAQIMGTKVTVTISVQDNQLIQNILSNGTDQQNLITDILSQINQRHLNGVTIDFEYSGIPDELLRQEFIYFSKNLKTALIQQNAQSIFNVSVMPLSARDVDLYNFSQLTPIYNHFIVMSYDYYGQTAQIAGPVQPMEGFKQGAYFFDVTTTYADYLKILPKYKLIMGIPTYGWEWAVLNGPTKNSDTYPANSASSYAAVISYARARQDSDLKPGQCQWDILSAETWCWFTDKQTGIDHQVWPVDNKMLQIRFNYAMKEKFGGVALWTLGLDQSYPDIWNMLNTKFTK